MGKEDGWKKRIMPIEDGEKHIHKWIQVLGKFHAHEMTEILKQNLSDKETYKKDYKQDMKEGMNFNEFNANYGLGKKDKKYDKDRIPKKGGG